MELGLSLGSSRPFGFMENPPEASNTNTSLSIGPVIIITKQRDQQYHQQQKQREENSDSFTTEEDREATIYESLTSPNSLKANNNNAVLQLDLLPHTPPAVAPMNFFPFHAPPLVNASGCSRGMGMNMLPAVATAIVRVEDEAEEEAVLSSSPNSAASSIFQMDLCMFSTRGRGCSSRASDENENSGDGRSRKKLRLSKEQSNFLEESFKEHNTLNPKQKIALAKQLHLRPRQVEVWFQNKRARNKLKQTELDCEDLKRCCDTLKEENRRLHKELEELRALKITSKPFYMQLPATTLTMCPSCSERVATNNSIISTPSRTVHCSRPDTTIAKTIDEPKAIGFPRFNPIFHSTAS